MEREPDGERGDGQDRRAPQDLSERAGQVLVPGGLRGDRVDRAFDRLVYRPLDHADEIVGMDPRKELSAVAEPPGGSCDSSRCA